MLQMVFHTDDTISVASDQSLIIFIAFIYEADTTSFCTTSDAETVCRNVDGANCVHVPHFDMAVRERKLRFQKGPNSNKFVFRARNTESFIDRD
jgi:hypothetical protein